MNNKPNRHYCNYLPSCKYLNLIIHSFRSDLFSTCCLFCSIHSLKSRSIFLLDCGTSMLMLVGSNVPVSILKSVFGKWFNGIEQKVFCKSILIWDLCLLPTGISSTSEIPDLCYDLPNTGTSDSENLHSFLESINVEKPYTPTIQIIRYAIRTLTVTCDH